MQKCTQLMLFLSTASVALHTVTAVMVMILQRAVNLRPALQCLSPGFICSSAATLRLSPRSPYRGSLPGTSWHPGYSLRKLHSKKASPGIPDRLPFSTVTEQDLAFFRKTLPGRTITDPDLLESCNVDWLKSARGESWILPAKTSSVFFSQEWLFFRILLSRIQRSVAETSNDGGSVPDSQVKNS